MALPTGTNVADTTRALLADTEISGGDIATNTILLPLINVAVGQMFDKMAAVGVGRVIRTVYRALPAYATIFDPVYFGLTDWLAPVEFRERGGLETDRLINSAGMIASGAPRNQVELNLGFTAAATALPTGALVTVGGMSGMTGGEGMYAVIASTTTSCILAGAQTVGTYTSGGRVGYSLQEFTPMVQRERILDNMIQSGVLEQWAIDGNVTRFPGATGIRELEVRYVSSSTELSAIGDQIAVHDCRRLLATLTAALFCYGRGARDTAQTMERLAFGADGTGGMMRDILLPMVKAKQATHYSDRQRPAYPSPGAGYIL